MQKELKASLVKELIAPAAENTSYSSIKSNIKLEVVCLFMGLVNLQNLKEK
jgi:hypothetical protein